jgi:hypothetical protein
MMFVKNAKSSMANSTRIVFGNEKAVYYKEDHRNEWVEELKVLQKKLNLLPRKPKLSYKHSNNNKIGDRYF